MRRGRWWYSFVEKVSRLVITTTTMANFARYARNECRNRLRQQRRQEAGVETQFAKKYLIRGQWVHRASTM